MIALAPLPHAQNQDRKSPESDGFRRDIQGIRAIAVAMVVIYHLFPAALPGGFAGVDVFFVISGYLITGHLWRGYARTGTVNLAGFWGRRARRLIPAAALVLTVTWIAARILQPAAQLADTARQVLASALYYQNFQLSADAVNYLNSADAATPVQHFWSLSVEEQFYLVWPLAFLLAAFLASGLAIAAFLASRFTARQADARRTRAGLALVLTAAMVVASLCYSVHETYANPSAAYFVTASRLWELGSGGLLAIAPARLAGALARQGWLGWLRARRGQRFGVRAHRVDGVPRRAGAASGPRYRRADRGRLRRRAVRPRAADLGRAHGVHRLDLVLAVPVALPGYQPVHGLARPGARPAGRAASWRPPCCSPG